MGWYKAQELLVRTTEINVIDIPQTRRIFSFPGGHLADQLQAPANELTRS